MDGSEVKDMKPGSVIVDLAAAGANYVEKRCSMKKTHVCIIYNFTNIYIYKCIV